MRQRKQVTPHIIVNITLTRSILPAAALLLLSALVLPGPSHSFVDKGVNITEAVLSADGIPQGALGGFDGDDQELSVACCELVLGEPTQDVTYFSIPAPAPEFSHAVSQARAPPLS